MPKIKIDSVISFSSEDPLHTANNLLSTDPTKKWKCEHSGEKSAIIVLQLEKASIISSIDIGNEHSAYIEILASRSSSLNNDDYKVFLVMSSFMTPIEARQSTNINKVRMFRKDDFSKPECEQKWDRIKIVCTQPFNRHVQYGLSFITFHSHEPNNNGAVQQKLGKFILRPNSPDNLSTGSLFARRKELQNEQVSAAAAIREASTSNSPAVKPKLKINNTTTNNHYNNNNKQSDNENDKKPRNRNEILYDKDDDEPNQRIDKVVEMKRKEKQNRETKELEDNKKKTPKKQTNNSNKTNVGASSKKETNKRQSSSGEESKKKRIKIVEKRHQTCPFSQLLNDVVLVISGIQNPDRANLRTSALAMGAKYKADWDQSCTHLICAFPNTPKFNKVRGHGKIVKRAWIEDCYSQRKRLPWRRYALDKNDVGEESEEEIWEKIDEPPQTSNVAANNDNDDDDEQTDVEGFDDEMEKRIAEMKAQENDNKIPYNLDTDDEVEEITTVSKEITDKLLDIFDKKRFYIDDDLDSDIKKLAARYIIAYKGTISKNSLNDAEIVITTEENMSDLKNSATDGDVVFVTPDWLWESHNLQTFTPFDKFKLE